MVLQPPRSPFAFGGCGVFAGRVLRDLCSQPHVRSVHCPYRNRNRPCCCCSSFPFLGALGGEQHPSSGRFLTVNGVRLHYMDSGGKGAPVVLIHGNTVTFEDWQLSGVSAKAEQRYRVIAFDRPGFGYSQRPRLKLWTPGAQADLIQQALVNRSLPCGWGPVGRSMDAPLLPSFRLALTSGVRASALLLNPLLVPVIRSQWASAARCGRGYSPTMAASLATVV